MDFGDAITVLSSKLKKTIIQYSSRVNQGRINEFRKKNSRAVRNGPTKEYWTCIECERLVESGDGNPEEPRCNITIVNGRITKDPDIDHHSLCTGKNFGQANAQNLNREARRNCKIGLKRPLEAHTNMNSEVAKRFRNLDESETVEENLQDFKSMKTSLRRWSRKGRVPVDDVYNLPIDYQVTERGRFAHEDAPYYHERWLLCSNAEQKILAFMSDQDVSVVHDSAHLIMDGTFKISPDGFTQLYTLHAWGAFQFEAMPICHALMRQKTMDSYVYLLSAIRNKLVESYNGIGELRFIHTDFELAAHNAIRNVFPEVAIKGCNFHFSQALNRKLQQLGLREIWNDDGITGEWIGCIKALAMLPACLIQIAFETILFNPPQTENQVKNQQLQSFRDYFQQTWIHGQFPISMWSHWDNPGPRTTNHAEGYHNRLNLAEVRHMHLAVRNFLHLLQPMHNRDQVRVRNLRRGAYLPKQRDETYVALDNRIRNLCNTFTENTHNIWEVDNFNAHLLQPHVFQFLMNEIHHFLCYMRHLIGKNRVLSLMHLIINEFLYTIRFISLLRA